MNRMFKSDINRFILYLLCSCFIVFNLTSCYLFRVAWYHASTMNDYKIFPYQVIRTSAPPFRFYENINNSAINTKLSSLNTKRLTLNADFVDFLTKTKTLSFIIIRNDTILYEKYFSGYDKSSVLTSFSVAKSFISALVGIAIDEGYIKSVKQPVTDFLTDLKDKNFRKVTIEDLLNMKTGIKFNENYSSPFSSVVKYYFGAHLKRYIRHLKVNQTPGVKYDYVSVSSLLLSQIVEKATGRKISDYLQDKIWIPLGMEYDATWSTDNNKDQTVKAFCGLNTHALDYAKFGRLYLDHGNWNGKQIISERWVDLSTSYSKDSTSSFYYWYQWRVGKHDFFAKGAKGQFIYVNPSKNIIIVRNGTEYGIPNWQDVFRDISDQL